MTTTAFTTDFTLVDSSWRNFPTETDPLAKYKYFSAHANMKPHLRHVKRKTQSLLDWLADWGGLLDGLDFVIDMTLSPYQMYALKTTLASLIVGFIQKKPEAEREKPSRRR